MPRTDQGYAQTWSPGGQYRVKLVVYDRRPREGDSPTLAAFRAARVDQHGPITFRVSFLDQRRYPHPSTSFSRVGQVVYAGPEWTYAWGAVLLAFPAGAERPTVPAKFAQYAAGVERAQIVAAVKALMERGVYGSQVEALARAGVI
jgi:hypothetical protein